MSAIFFYDYAPYSLIKYAGGLGKSFLSIANLIS